jgi:hypothetical protein
MIILSAAAFAFVTIAMPAQIRTATDAFGTRDLPDGTPGLMAGAFGCAEAVYPCEGAYELDFMLPYAIDGYAGTLSYAHAYGRESPIFDLPPSETHVFTYDGFYGEVFDAPTSTIRLIWPPGLLSADDHGAFTLMDAQVIPVPEPTSAWPFLAALLGLFSLRRWR